MKVKIFRKNIKQGVSSNGTDYCIKSLGVSFTETEVYNKLVEHLKSMNCTQDEIEKFVQSKEYGGTINYSLFINCSGYTFDAVEKYGILDAKIVFQKNEKGYLNARIQVVDKIEQVLSYEAPESNVTGWAAQTTHTPSAPKPSSTYTQEHQPKQPSSAETDLPF